MLFSACLLLLGVSLCSGAFQAGVAKIDGTLPIGVPLAGYNHGTRRYKDWPLPQPRNYTNWMAPSTGVMDPTWVKALVLDDGSDLVCMVTVDAIGSDENLNTLAYGFAVEMGFTIPVNNVLFSMSHSHSGPGAVSSDFLWAFAPATDLLVPELQRALAQSMATAMVQALKNVKPAQFAVGSFNLTGVTQNRRARISPIVKIDSIDPHFGVIRVDDAQGNPIATVWNFAMHGVCYGPENMHTSGDIMGKACELAEDAIGGTVLFINADAGDIDPTSLSCSSPPQFTGAMTIAKFLQAQRATMTTTTTVDLTPTSNVVDFGPTNINATLERFNNCTHGGFLDMCSICAVLRCDLNPHLGSAWIEHTPRFFGLRITIGNDHTIIVSMPGEPLLELGWWVRNDTAALGFTTTFLAGYSNAHMGYFAPPIEYDVGGYESQLTFWGIDTAIKVRTAVKAVASSLAPNVV